ncbi:MAG TPA: hypothetical protein VNU68_00595 [Verrucomicrobiae bacterium]|nr:hypothetical protein [Verrucomicrobiae bacterium]
MLYCLPHDTRTESEWLDVAAIISGQRVLTDGRLESLKPAELATAWQRAALRAAHKALSE